MKAEQLLNRFVNGKYNIYVKSFFVVVQDFFLNSYNWFLQISHGSDATLVKDFNEILQDTV